MMGPDLDRSRRERVDMKMSREVPVTAFQGGEGLLPAYQRLVREKVIPY